MKKDKTSHQVGFVPRTQTGLLFNNQLIYEDGIKCGLFMQ